MPDIVGILDFAYQLGFTNLYPWQQKTLVRYAAGQQTALQACNYSGKTSTVFVIAALWTLYNFPKARVQYISATFDQVRNQFFQSIKRLSDRHAIKSWTWLETELRTPQNGILFGRSTAEGGRIEGIHDEPSSPAALLVDEAKSVNEDVLDALSRCTTTFRLFASSTGQAYGGFYSICTDNSHLWKTFRVTSSDCPHIAADKIEEDRQNLKDSVFRIKHSCEWLFDAGDSMISLEAVRALLAAQKQAARQSAAPATAPQLKHPPGALNAQGIPYADLERYNSRFVDPISEDRNANLVQSIHPGFVAGPAKLAGSSSGRLTAFIDFASGGSCETVLALCLERTAWIEAFTKDPDTMSVVGWLIGHFRRLGLKSYQIGADEGGVGRVYCDRLAEQGYYVTRVNNGERAKDPEHFVNLSAQQWATVAELIEQQLITIRNCDEILVKQLCSRRKFYDSSGRTKLESKSEMKENSPDRADALIGAICMGFGGDPYATRPRAKKENLAAVSAAVERMSRANSPFKTEFIDFSRWP